MINKLVHLSRKGVKSLVTMGPEETMKKIVKFSKKRYFMKYGINKLHLTPARILEKQRKDISISKIKFSIITPLYNTPEKFLRELIESLQEQTYENWELCLADGSDRDHLYVEKICRRYMKNDHRIKYSRLTKNNGISENTNECIKMASGDYLGLLDHDDLLHPAALYEVAKVIEQKNAEFIYTDEVKFSERPEQIMSVSNFNFKPGFGKDELRAHNYICHFTVFAKKLLDKEEKLYRKEYDGSQDHDMVLRLTEKAHTIVHIPKVLYYWRVHSNSVSMDIGTKPYVVDAALGAIGSQLERCKEPGEVMSNFPYQTIYRIKYELKESPLVSIIVLKDKKNCKKPVTVQEILKKTHYRPLEIIVEDSVEEVCEEDGVHIKAVLTQGVNSKGSRMDKMLFESNGSVIVLTEDTMQPDSGEWLEEMLMFAQRQDVGSVGAKIFMNNSKIYYAGGVIDWEIPECVKYIGKDREKNDDGYEAILTHVRNTSITLSKCMMFQKELWILYGGFQNAPSGFETEDFCLWLIDQKKRNVWCRFSEWTCCNAEIEAEKDGPAFRERWKDTFGEDEYYHPNWKKLSLV